MFPVPSLWTASLLLLWGFASPAQANTPELKGKADGYKYTVTLGHAAIKGLDNLSGITFHPESDQAIGISFDLPQAEVTAELKLKAKPRKNGDDLFFGLLDEDFKVKRRYGVTVRGVRGKLTLKVDAESGQLSLSNLRLTGLEFQHVKIRLTREKDGWLTSLANDFTLGSIDQWIKDTIRAQLTGPELGPRVARHLKETIQNQLASWGSLTWADSENAMGLAFKVEPHGLLSVETVSGVSALQIPIRVEARSREGYPIRLHTEGATATLSVVVSTEPSASIVNLQGWMLMNGERLDLAALPHVTDMMNAFLKPLQSCLWSVNPKK